MAKEKRKKDGGSPHSSGALPAGVQPSIFRVVEIEALDFGSHRKFSAFRGAPMGNTAVTPRGEYDMQARKAYHTAQALARAQNIRGRVIVWDSRHHPPYRTNSRSTPGVGG